MAGHGYFTTVTPADQVIFHPRRPRPGKRGVVLCHGAGGTGNFWASGVTGDGGSAAGAMPLAAAIAGAGIPCIGSDQGGAETFGIDAVVQSGGAIDTDWAALAAAADIATDKVLLVGISMGTNNTFRYMATQPAKVAGAVAILPMASMHDFYENNKGGFATTVATAWGVTSPAALPSRAYFEVAGLAAIASSGPVRGFYSTADAIMTPSLEPAFAEAIGATYTVMDTVHGHSDLSVGEIDDGSGSFPDVIAFLKSCGA